MNKAHIQSKYGNNDGEKLGQPCEHINMPLNYQLFAHGRPTEKVCNRRKNLDFEGYLSFVPLILVQAGPKAHYSLLYKGYQGSFPEIERPGRAVGHPSHLASRLKK
jgi:hypothetical protein